MKDEYLKAYQQRIEEIKTLDVSPEEKRKLAADAKNEILDQYRTSYLKEKEEAAKREVEETVIETNKNDLDSDALEIKVSEDRGEQAPELTEENDQDDIGSILNKLEERKERGEVGIDLEQPTEFMDPDALFSTMNLDELFTSLGFEDELEDDNESDNIEELTSFEDVFMDGDALFAGLLDDFDEVEDEVDSEIISNEYDITEEPENLEPKEALNDQAAEAFNMINNEEAIVDQSTSGDIQEVVDQEQNQDVQTTGDDSPKLSIETEVEEIEELVEGSIIDEDDVEELSSEELDPEMINEIEELEKERERAQKLGIIELALLVVLIILVIIVVYLIMGGV